MLQYCIVIQNPIVEMLLSSYRNILALAHRKVKGKIEYQNERKAGKSKLCRRSDILYSKQKVFRQWNVIYSIFYVALQDPLLPTYLPVLYLLYIFR
jgi:hypothetical protein